MARTTPHAQRLEVVERHLAGQSLPSIAAALQLNPYTVRKFWRLYQSHGWDALVPHLPGPAHCGPLAFSHPRIKYVLLRLKRAHRGWGVDKLRLELTRRPSLQGHAIPQRSTLASYLAQFGARLRRPRRAPTRRPSAVPAQPPSQPHQCWQMDFKGDEHVAGCRLRIAPFLVCDSASGAPLGGHIHAIRGRGNRAGVGMREVQADLRALFCRWGLPDALRMDRDSVFVGSCRLEWPGTLLLWLIGLGVQPIINRAYRPTDNAIVERNHQTWQAHVLEGSAYADLAEVQAATEQAFADRREALPSRHLGCERRPFLEAYPQLACPRRVYVEAEERVCFKLERLDAYLSEWKWRRTVDGRGQISLANRNYKVGEAYCGQSVRVCFDPTDRQLVCQLANGEELRRMQVPELEVEYILGLKHGEPR
jgi:transposase InsO family protein